MTAPDRASAAAVVDGIDVDALAAAVRACPAVAGLSGGVLGSAGTYLPGRRVTGIVVRSPSDSSPEVTVHVVARYGPSMAEVAGQVRSAAAVLVPGSLVDVAIDDVAMDDVAFDNATTEGPAVDQPDAGPLSLSR